MKNVYYRTDPFQASRFARGSQLAADALAKGASTDNCLSPVSKNLTPAPPGRTITTRKVATDTQEETDRYWNAIVDKSGQESPCGWCKDRWGLSWQITPRTLTEAMAAGGAEARRAFEAMMEMGKIDIAKIDAARRG